MDRGGTDEVEIVERGETSAAGEVEIVGTSQKMESTVEIVERGETSATGEVEIVGLRSRMEI